MQVKVKSGSRWGNVRKWRRGKSASDGVPKTKNATKSTHGGSLEKPRRQRMKKFTSFAGCSCCLTPLRWSHRLPSSYFLIFSALELIYRRSPPTMHVSLSFVLYLSSINSDQFVTRDYSPPGCMKKRFWAGRAGRQDLIEVLWVAFNLIISSCNTK